MQEAAYKIRTKSILSFPVLEITDKTDTTKLLYVGNFAFDYDASKTRTETWRLVVDEQGRIFRVLVRTSYGYGG